MIAEPWLDKRKLADHLSCSVRSVELLMTRGLPYAILIGRPKFRASEVESWLFAHGEVDLHGDRATLPVSDERSVAA